MQESRRLLSERDRELAELKTEVETYKMQAAREIANKTKIAKSLDESLSHVREMEELTEQWQLEVKYWHHEHWFLKIAHLKHKCTAISTASKFYCS